MDRLTCQTITDFETDAVRVVGNHSAVIACTIHDTLVLEHPELAQQAHRDGIQLAPDSQGKRLQYAGALLENVLITGNRIHSSGKLQCVFGSDGLMQGVRIVGNVLDTQGQHFISLNGCVHDCWLEGNVLPDGSPAPIRLAPLRLAGEQNVYVLSFKQPEFYYPPLPELVDEASLKAGVVTDHRFTAFSTGARYLDNFDVYGFWRAVEQIELSEALRDPLCGAQRHTQLMAEIALQFGNLH